MVSPRTATLVSLGALPAMVAYMLATDLVIAIAVVNVVLIAASLYLLFSPVAGEHAAHA